MMTGKNRRTKRRIGFNKELPVDIHADDYAQSPHTSAQILECCKLGYLDSISIVPNFSCFEQDMALLRAALQDMEKKPLLCVHLNLVEGRCVAQGSLKGPLTDENGYFRMGWGSLFLHSFLPGQKALGRALETEICAQIEKVRRALPDDYASLPIRIDGHQHTQMIPVVFDALCRVIRREGYAVSYIRDSREPLGPYLKHPSLLRTYRPVNLLKNLILRLCSLYLRAGLKALGCAPMYLWGLLMSGKMDRERVELLLPDMGRAACRKGNVLEILFHPGRLLPAEVSEEYSNRAALPFYLSPDREVERAALAAVSKGRNGE